MDKRTTSLGLGFGAALLLIFTSAAIGADASGAAQTVSAVERLGRLHIIAVHFPIALLACAGALEAVRIILRAKAMWNATIVMVAIGAASALVAMGTGLIHEEAVEAFADHALLETHETLGIASAIVASVALAMCLLARWKKVRALSALATFLVIASAALVCVAAHFGGSMVWGRGYFLPW